MPLDGATVFGELYAFVNPLFPDGYEAFTTVDFLINGELVHTEWAAPYDSVSGGTEKANESLDTTTLPEGINTMNLPSEFQWDVSIAKAFDVGSTWRFEMYADIFNVTNHENVRSVQQIITFSNYGEPLSFLLPRTAQLGVRVTF